MYLQFQGFLSTGQEPLDIDLRDLVIAEVDGAQYLYTSTLGPGGLTAYALDQAGGSATLVDVQYFGAQGANAAMGIAEVAVIGGQAQLIFGSTGTDSLVSYTIGSGGTLGGLASHAVGGSPAAQMTELATIDLGGSLACYIVDGDTGALSVHLLPGGGAGQIPQFSTTSFVLGAGADVDTVMLGAQRFLLATDQVGNGVTSYAVDAATGGLTQVGYAGAADGLGVALPTAMETVTAFGQSWVVLGSAGSNSLSVLRLDASGGLTPTDHLIDTLHTRFDGLTSLAIAQEGDRVFVVAGGADDGLSLFTLAPDGRLIHLQSVAQSLAIGLENPNRIDAAVVGDTLQVFVSSATLPGLNQFNIPLADLGVTQRASPGAQSLSGGAGDDMLTGSDSGADTLSGGAGDDILISGVTGGDLRGGAGADRFVIHGEAALTRVMDFQVGIDQLDLSDLPFLRSVDQLAVLPTAWGARVTFRDTTIDVYSASGGSLDGADIFGAGLTGPDRIPVILPEVVVPDGPTIGDDSLVGTAGNETIVALDGDDTVEAGDGADSVRGEGGADLIFGGGGADTLDGGVGDDTAWGGAGDDLVRGGAGNDLLGGSRGNDTIEGGDGNDEAWASADNDLLFGGLGDDTLGGGTGNDTVWGEAGDDVLWGGRNLDLVYGGAGNDVVGGGPREDQLWGDAGNDTFWANTGNDTLWGGTGDDLMGGGTDDDLAYGEAGDDVLQLGQGNDTGYGGDGWDTLLGAEGDDELIAGTGNDQLEGEAGRDRMWGEGGNDLLLGGIGNDTLDGGADNDTLWAGSGNDQLIGGTGNDVLSGEAGADQFVFYANSGNDRIRDFTPNEDLILIGGGANSFGELHMMQQGSTAIIAFGTVTISLRNTDITELDPWDFLFF